MHTSDNGCCRTFCFVTARLQPSYTGDLPIHERRDSILATLRAHQVVVIAGETGSGKTTQLPKFLLECGLGQKGWIGCTQPRRVAALSVAQRIAEELQVPYGGPVGSKIRFTDATREETVIKVMTDGILLNELQEDPLLRGYEAIIIDEAHERSLNIDFILGCLRNLVRKRADLKVVITSATIDTARFAEAFDNAPIIEVSGRMYPVELHYCPVEDLAEGERDFDALDAAAKVVNRIIAENGEGDILVFLPGERDIQELRRMLEGSPAGRCDLLPLFGRLSNADQQRIFHPDGRRRIILSTNIAETSLTVPGIRFVVDSGLARISRYSPHSRTLRLPIEPIAQSSADQRKGRCGRVSNGTCYRLYTEADFQARERFTTPEIHRSNLASVILRMMAFRLGDIRTFPFIDPPAEPAIVGGYRLLAELGAVTLKETEGPTPDVYQLTPLGRRLSRLPVDPTVGRMLLQAETEQVLEDVLIIAAGLSIQDPRERPADAAAEADEKHRPFIHPKSDFLTLLQIWNAYHDKLDSLSQNQLRKFCKTHFLAYQRMREWRDIHHQIARFFGKSGLGDTPQGTATPRCDERSLDCQSPRYAAIHRSILAGLLSNIAHKEVHHDYRGPHQRKAMLFPGSGLFDHEAAKKQRKATYAKKAKPKPIQTSAPEWIVCGEWMETSQLFARNAAYIEVEWIESIAGELLKVRHSEPFWSIKSAAALCKERRLLFGLEITRSHVSYTPINPDEATDLFVRNGLVEEGIRERPAFLLHNAALRETAASEIVRLQLGSATHVEDYLYQFYRSRLSGVGSFAELRRFAKKHHGGALDFLKATLEDLLPQTSDDGDNGFPETLHLGGHEVVLQYRNEPGHESDGVTLKLPLPVLETIQQATLDWAIPGFLEETVFALLRGLPKDLRVRLHPLKERAREVVAKLKPSPETLIAQLTSCLQNDHGTTVYRDQWQVDRIPETLKPRIVVLDTDGETLFSGRSLEAIQEQLQQQRTHIRQGDGYLQVPAWQTAAARYERSDLRDWTFGDLPEQIDLSGASGVPLAAYPALVADGDCVHVRLLARRAAALESSKEAWPLLCEIAMGRESAWIQKELRSLKSLGLSLLPLGGFEIAYPQAWEHLRRHLFAASSILPLRRSTFEAALLRASSEKADIVLRFLERLKQLLDTRAEVEQLLQQKKTSQALSFPGMRSQLDAVAPPDLLLQYDFEELPDLTRFLRGMLMRARRARESVVKDMEKAARIAPFEYLLQELQQLAAKQEQSAAAKPFRLLLEEFKISVFAQEIGTRQKSSEKRLNELYQNIHDALRG